MIKIPIPSRREIRINGSAAGYAITGYDFSGDWNNVRLSNFPSLETNWGWYCLSAGYSWYQWKPEYV